MSKYGPHLTAKPGAKKDMHPQDHRNLILFIIMATVLYFAYDAYIMRPQMETLKASMKQEQAQQDFGTALEEAKDVASAAPIATPRLPIRTSALKGSINLQGAKLDDLALNHYFQTLKNEKRIKLLSPKNEDHARQAEFGWLSADGVAVPDAQTIWTPKPGSPDTLTADEPVTLYWNNGNGLIFERTIAIDNQYMFTITQRITNTGGKDIMANPYALIAQKGLPREHYNLWIVHEGPLGYINGELVEKNYDDLHDQSKFSYDEATGWAGITEKYWFTALIPPTGEASTLRYLHEDRGNPKTLDPYQVDVLGPSLNIAPGNSAEHTIRFFAGAKELDTLKSYEENLNIPHFDLAVDFGTFYFLTYPIYLMLDFFFGLVGNFGIAIILMVLVLRTAVFPLANTSYRSFAQLRKISPKILELRKQYGDEDRQGLQKALMELYQREKVNPLAGCLPILIQIPIFFALYKVLTVTLEMRHAPFYGWIQDLSAPDPTSALDLFGLLPYDAPAFLGAWPLIFLVSLLIQQRLTPPPQDPTQAWMMRLFPFFMVFILGGFASGLVIYWTFSNIFSTVQQYVIMRMMGVRVNIFTRTREEIEMEEAISHGPHIHPEAALAIEEADEAISGEHHDAPANENKPAQKPKTKPKAKKSKKKKK